MDLAREFSLPKDQDELDCDGWKWETVRDGGNQWLIIHDFPLPEGYVQSTAQMAILIPPSYPDVELEMFYVSPPLQRRAGGTINATQGVQSIRGSQFQRWSRHRVPSAWQTGVDNIATHLGFINRCLRNEVIV